MGRTLPALLLACLACAWSTPARAYEDQASFGVAAGYRLAASDLPQHGLTLGVNAGLGLDDIWTLRLRGGYSEHPAAGGYPTGHLVDGAVELIYMLDVLQWVPYAGLGAGALWLRRNGDDALGVSVHVVAGLDYLYSRRWVFGLELRGTTAHSADTGLFAYSGAMLAVRRLFEI